MRIAFIAVKGIPIGGGVEKVTEEIGLRLVRRGHRVVTYSSRDYGTTKDGLYKGIEVRTVSSINSKAFHKLSICLHATADILRRKDADIVHFHAVGPSVFSIFPRFTGIPTIVQTHGVEWKRDKWGIIGRTFFRLSDYSVAYFPTRATAVSMVQKDYYERKFGVNVVYIPNGVTPVNLRSPEWIIQQGLVPRKYFLFAARLVEEKGAHFLIPAFRTLNTDMKLVIAGDAAHSERYKAHLRELAGDDPRIVFPGFVTGRPLEELFSSAYLFCLPSTLEGLPIALLEAMSYGNCCVASDIPENLEAVREHAYTFRSRDIDDLRRILQHLLDHPEEAEGKRQAARDYVLENYSWDSITDQMEALYYSVLDQCGKRR